MSFGSTGFGAAELEQRLKLYSKQPIFPYLSWKIGELAVQRVRTQGAVAGLKEAGTEPTKPAKTTSTKAKSSTSPKKSASRTKKSTDSAD